MSKQVLGNKAGYYEKIQAFEKLLQIVFVIDYNDNGAIRSIKFDEERKRLYQVSGLVSCYVNTINTRIKCPICVNHKKNHQCKVYKSTQSVSLHLVSSEHKQDSCPVEIQQGLKLVENHSLMLQMKMLGEIRK
ncbi:MAG: hypothetical protein ISR80_04520 [Nitrosopumilus sp.]|nr:hypothetical protein [Nitrosopumilus sp.]